jgi:UDP-N-acetylglucosamine--N-acetylmuramyl-(pentapeptide) pyrophosphoryl-undecaprenol N-acetylglucosamine transferase
VRGPLLIAAGGTGGHMFPALALGRELRRRGHEVAVLTDARGRRYLDCELPCHVVSAGSPSGGVAATLAGIGSLARGFGQSVPLLRRLRPAAAAVFGGYASVPAALAAAVARVPVLLHEQNAVFGRANRLIARFATVVALSFGDTEAVPQGGGKRLVSGNPVRPGFGVDAVPYVPPAEGGPFRLLVMGGSQGARVFSDVVPAAIGLLRPGLREHLEIAQQCRPEDLDRARAAYANLGLTPELAPFFTDAPVRMREAHLVITRSGASTISELLLLARPAILVPYPLAADDHQTANATRLAAVGAARFLPQPELTPQGLAALLAELVASPNTLAAMARHASELARPDAAAVLADAVLSLANGDRQ